MGAERPTHHQRRRPVLYLSHALLLAGRCNRRIVDSDLRTTTSKAGPRFVSRVTALPFVCVERRGGGAPAIFHHSAWVYRTIFIHLAETVADGGGIRLCLLCDR